jgi:hypothetical protein
VRQLGNVHDHKRFAVVCQLPWQPQPLRQRPGGFQRRVNPRLAPEICGAKCQNFRSVFSTPDPLSSSVRAY